MSAPDYFQVFGLAPKLALDLADLEQRFYRLSRESHPDRFQRGTPAERERSLDASATLNDAYRRTPLIVLGNSADVSDALACCGNTCT